LCFRSIQTEQKPVIEVGWIVNPIFIEDEGARKGTQLDQPVPIGGIPRQPRHFKSHHHAHLAESNLADKSLKSVPTGRLGAGFAEIAIEDVNTFQRPSQRHGAIAQCVLALRALSVLQYLARRGLADVEVCILL
jgi:hypothetical protein